MRIQTLDLGTFRLDGGAMFGVVPRPIWEKINPPDARNRIKMATRCLLIEHDGHLIVVDTGLGDKQDAKFFGHYEREGDGDIRNAVKRAGVDPKDVTDVILTHLHFDHCGGATYLKDGKPQLSFPNAKYWTSEEHWHWATVQPNPREKASFLPENLHPLHESGNLHFFLDDESPLPGLNFLEVSGHTEAMILPFFEVGGRMVLYCADLIPTLGHIPVPYVMGYDVRPLLSMEEKTDVLEQALAGDWVLLFEHDADNECCTLEMTEKGIRAGEVFKFGELG